MEVSILGLNSCCAEWTIVTHLISSIALSTVNCRIRLDIDDEVGLVLVDACS